MIVLLHPQGFTDTPRGKTQIQSSLCHSQAVSQPEFGRIRSSDATVEDEKHRPSPIATGGIWIVLRATFKIDDSKRFLLRRLKRTMSFLINQLSHQQLQMKKNHTIVTTKRTFQ